MRTTLPSGTPVELVQPADARRGVVVAADIHGLRPLFDDLAAHLAAEHAWSVAVVEPFPGRESLTPEERLAAMADMVDARQVGDLVVAADLLGAEPVGVLGFCMGGMYAMKAAATDRFDKAAAFYGMIRLPKAWRGPGQAEALDVLTAMPAAAARTLEIIGTADAFTPPADVEALEAAGATVIRYEGADHGFVHDPSRPAHRPDDAADAWRRAIAWLSGADA